MGRLKQAKEIRTTENVATGRYMLPVKSNKWSTVPPYNKQTGR